MAILRKRLKPHVACLALTLMCVEVTNHGGRCLESVWSACRMLGFAVLIGLTIRSSRKIFFGGSCCHGYCQTRSMSSLSLLCSTWLLSLCLSAGAAKLNSPSAGGRQEEGCCDYRVGGARIKAVSNPSPGVLTRAAGQGPGQGGHDATMLTECICVLLFHAYFWSISSLLGYWKSVNSIVNSIELTIF